MWVALGLGSNADARANLASCLDALLLQFRDLALSSVFQSAPEGGSGGPYLNMVVAFESDMPLLELRDFAKALERKLGRRDEEAAQGRVHMDIDVLVYGDLVGEHAGLHLPRPQLLDTAYVLRPLAQVAGKRRHPVVNDSYVNLWKQFAGDSRHMEAVDFEWHGRRLSNAAQH